MLELRLAWGGFPTGMLAAVFSPLQGGRGSEVSTGAQATGAAQVPHDAVCPLVVGFGGPGLCCCVSSPSLIKS